MRVLEILLSFVIVNVCFSSAQSQSAGQDQVATGADFRALTDQRTQLDSEVHGLQRRIDQLNSELGNIGNAKGSLGYWQGEFKSKNPAAAAEVKAWTDSLRRYRSEDVVKKELDDTTKELSEKQHQLSSVELKINAAIDIERPRQNFKQTLSIAFTALIGLVILGFFWIIKENPSVGSSIFAGDAGLQFITLFSLIIAIILFGLTEVLQGRELAALLGGISGYILGRSARGRDATSGIKGNSDVAGGSGRVGLEAGAASSEAGAAHDEGAQP